MTANETETGEPHPFTGLCACGGDLHDDDTICDTCRRRDSDTRLHARAQAVAAEIKRRRFLDRAERRDDSRDHPLPGQNLGGTTSQKSVGA